VDRGETEVALERIIALQKYSKLSRLLRVTALVIRFVKNLKKSTLENGELQRNLLLTMCLNRKRKSIGNELL